MRISLNEIKKIEQYLRNELSIKEQLVFEARMLTSSSLRLNVLLQRKIYSLLKAYQRRNVKEKAKCIHERIFNDPSKELFRTQISDFFKPQ